MKEDYCDLETSKLLKNKGFVELTNAYYDEYGQRFITPNSYIPKGYSSLNSFILCPTHQLVMKYLRKVYKLHITTKPYITTEGIMFVYEIYKLESDKFTLLKSKAGFKESEEAVEAAIKDCLTNLI